MREDEQLVADASSLEFGEVDVGPEERHLDAQALGSVGLGLQIDLDVTHAALGVGLGIERDDQVVVLLLDAVVEVVAIELELLQQLVFLVHLRVVNLYHALALTQDVLDVAVRVQNVLQSGFNVETIWDLVHIPPQEFMKRRVMTSRRWWLVIIDAIEQALKTLTCEQGDGR